MRRAATVLVPLGLAALVLLIWGAAWPEAPENRPWALIALLALPGLLWAPGVGWAARLDGGRSSGLSQTLDAVWISLGWTLVSEAIARESGARGLGAAWVQWALAALFGGLGLLLARAAPAAQRTPRRERLAAVAVAVTVGLVALWRAHDLQRPLDGSWFLTGADDPPAEVMKLEPGDGWVSVEAFGWPEAGARALVPRGTQGTLSAPDGARGRLVLAVRGPIGSWVQVGDQKNTVERAMTESDDEGSVARYLDAGVAAISVPVDLPAGGTLDVEVHGERLYVMPGTDAIWALHSVGELRYVHYYQILNQVENQVWAEELLTERWLTLNQPPGWSPILAVASLWVSPDLQGANALFLGVLLLVGWGAVRLVGATAPGASGPAWGLPAAMVASHGLLMIEPGSTNFPDSLYAAALVGAMAALASGRTRAFSGLGFAAAILRYPGAVAALIWLGAWTLASGRIPRAALRSFAVALALLAALVGVFLLAGVMEDAAFIVYFEIFPEHWHGDYALSSLLPRIPEFYGTWCLYTGGACALAILGLPGPSTPARTATRAILGGAFTYSAILATVDHHPTHYFLPLVALSGPALAAASAALGERRPWLGLALPIVALIGVGHLLWVGSV